MLTGLGLMAVFTIFWAMWAVFSGSVVIVGLGVLLVAIGLLFLVRRVQLRDADVRERDRGGSRILPIALGVEIVAILVAVVVLRTVDPELIQPAIAVVVGLHFLVFQADERTRHRMHLVTAGAGVLIGLAGLVAIADGAAADVVHGLVGVGMASLTTSYGARFLRALRA